MAKTRASKALQSPNTFTDAVHAKLGHKRKWRLHLMAVVADKDAVEVIKDALDAYYEVFRRKNTAAYEAQEKKYGSWEKPTHGRAATK